MCEIGACTNPDQYWKNIGSGRWGFRGLGRWGIRGSGIAASKQREVEACLFGGVNGESLMEISAVLLGGGQEWGDYMQHWGCGGASREMLNMDNTRERRTCDALKRIS